MNNRYVYGYGLGWDVENQYLNSLDEIIQSYNDQVSLLEKINTSIEDTKEEINRTSNFIPKTIDEKQIRQWYNQDILQNNSLLSFESYKKQILESIDKANESNKEDLTNKNQELSNNITKKENEYVANLKILIDIKQETRKLIFKRKKELELLLSEKEILLSSILLEQRKTLPEYDENRNVVNKEQLSLLRDRYDETWLEIRKIEHAIEELDKMVELTENTKEEISLMMKGLNPTQKLIYDGLVNSKGESVDVDLEIPSSELEPPIEVGEAVPVSKEPTEVVEPEQSTIPEEIEDPIVKSDITLEEIVTNVCGNEKFNDGQSSRYAASKIKVISKPQKDNLGLGYKIVSIPRTVIGIIPRAAMKFYGLFVSKETRDIFEGMEERANNLTDEEVRVLLKEYKGQRAQSFRLPKGFNDAVRPRIDRYVGSRIAVINEEILDNLKVINYCEKVINNLKDRLISEESPEMIEKIETVLDAAYSRAYPAVKDIISLQIEGNELQNGNGLHSFDEELKALNTKMNYIGGRFSKAREYDPMLWSKISGYSHTIEYSNKPVDVVDSFIEREKIYKENTKEKRSIFNLGSKVTAGKLDYRPFVETLNYGNDPFIRDLITSVLVVSSTVSLINNINNSLSNQSEIIKEANERIAEANKTGVEQQQFIENVRGSGESLEKGMIYDIKHTEGSIENLADRGVDIAHNWKLSGSSYKAADAAHHLETGSLSVQNTEAILNLSNQYSSGAITYAEYLKGISELKDQTTEVYERYINELSSTIENYASTHPQFDYTAVLSSLRHAPANSADSAELSEMLTGLYEQSLNVSNFESLSAIEATLNSTTLVPDILTLGAVVAKVSQEEVDTRKQVRQNERRATEIRETIKSLREMRAELTLEEIKEIEALLR